MPELRDAVHRLARGLEIVDGSRERVGSIERDLAGNLILCWAGRRIASTTSVGTLLANLVVALEEEAERVLTGRATLHAAVLADRGRAIVVAGHSWSGKSTLATALVARGLQYGTDDVTRVDPGGLLTPYPRPILLRPGARELVGSLGEAFDRVAYDLADGRSFEWLAPRAVIECPMGASVIALLDRVSASLAIEAMGAGEATARLLAHFFDERATHEQLRLARDLVGRASRLVVIRGGAPSEIASALADIVGHGDTAPR